MSENAKSPNTPENTTANPTVPAGPSTPTTGRDWSVTSTPATRTRKGSETVEETPVETPRDPEKDGDRDEEDDEESKRAKRIAKKEKHQPW